MKNSKAIFGKTSLAILLSLPMLSEARTFFHQGKGYYTQVDDQNVEIGFSMKLFGGPAGQDPISVAQGVAELPFEVDIKTQAPIQCDVSKMGTPIAAARTAITATTENTNFTFKISEGQEILCQTSEDRKIQVTYRIRKNIAENAFAQQINQTLDELKRGSLTSDFSKTVLKTVVLPNMHATTLRAGAAEIQVLGNKQVEGTPMIALIMADSLVVGGVAIPPTGKPDSESHKNVYPKLNRFALVCGFSNDQGEIKETLVPNDSSVNVWIKNSPNEFFGCIANNSPDGYSAIDPYVEDPTYQLHYLVMPLADFKMDLDKIKLQITESIDEARADKLEKVAKTLVDANKARVQAEMDRRRVDVLVKAGYFAEQSIDVRPLAYFLSLSGKPRYSQGVPGQVKMDTVFDIQGERVNYEFDWVDGSRIAFVEDGSWVGLKDPIVSQKYETKYSRFSTQYRICASRADSVRKFLTAMADSPGQNYSTELVANLTNEANYDCAKQAVVQKRLLKYTRYDGSCYSETPYAAKDGSGKQLVRFKPARIDLVYTDASGHAIGKVKLDLTKIADSLSLFSGLDVVTTLPYDATRAASYSIQCDGKGWLPVNLFKPTDLAAQKDVPGFPTLIGDQPVPAGATSATPSAPAADPNAGKIDLRLKP